MKEKDEVLLRYFYGYYYSEYRKNGEMPEWHGLSSELKYLISQTIAFACFRVSYYGYKLFYPVIKPFYEKKR